MPDTDQNRAQSIAELFREVFELSVADRLTLYDRDDVPHATRAEVEALLAENSHPVFAEERLGSTGRSLAFEPAPPPWQAGARVGDYEIVGEVARGGMGVVFEARQLSLGRAVAIKVIHGGRLLSASDTKRFRAEAEAIARLEHPGIVPVHEVVEHDGLQFYSMPFFPRGSLGDLERPLSPIAAAELATQVCDAIHYAHTQNIVHRDLKPANVLLTDTLQPRVSDFGLAKKLGDDADDVTRTGAILGTPGFMAPEQANGDGGSTGHLADVYGLGGVLFFALTGKPPITGRTIVETLHNVVHAEPCDVRQLAPAVPADLASICQRALEKAPVRRYGSAAAMATDLRRFLRGEPTEARPLGTGQRFVRWCRRRPGLATLSAVAVLSLLGGGATSFFYAVEADAKATELAASNDKLKRSAAAATAARADAEAFSAFLLDDLVRTARTADRGGISTAVSLRDALLAAIPRIGQRFAGRPLAEAAARHEIGITLQHVGEGDASLEQLRLARDIRARELGPNDAATLDSRRCFGSACLAAERYEDAVAEFESLLPIAEAGMGPNLPQALENLGISYEQVHRFDEAHAVLERAVEISTGIERLRCLSALAIAQTQVGRRTEARASIRELKHSGYSRNDTAMHDREFIDHNLLRCFILLEDDEEAARLGLSLLYRDRRLHGQADPITVRVARQISMLGDIRMPPRVAMEALETLVHRNGKHDSRRNRRQAARAARLALLAGFPERALPHAAHAHALWYASDPEHSLTFATEALLCEAMLETGQREEAISRLQRRVELLRARLAAAATPGSDLADQHEAYREALRHFEELIAK